MENESAKSNEHVTDISEFEEEIVNVNDVGQRDTGAPRKLVLLLAILGIILVIVLYGSNAIRGEGEQPESPTSDAEQENKAATVTNRRVFGSQPKKVALADPEPVSVPEVVSVVEEPRSKFASPYSTGNTSSSGKEVKSRYSGGIFSKGASTVSAVEVDQDSRYEERGNDMDSAMNRIISAAEAQSSGGSAPVTGYEMNNDNSADEQNQSSGNIGSKLQTSEVSKVSATRSGNLDLMIGKGQQITCVLDTRIISQLVGYVACVLDQDIYSESGKVILLEKGSRATGEYTDAMTEGDTRVFVVWDRIRTDNGVDIRLDSPATDTLGTSGLPGFVDNRWVERIGGAFMLSIIKDVIGYYTAKDSGGGGIGADVYSNTSDSGEDFAGKVLEKTINKKPILYKNQGDTVAMFVSRDLDFSNVYSVVAR